MAVVQRLCMSTFLRLRRIFVTVLRRPGWGREWSSSALNPIDIEFSDGAHVHQCISESVNVVKRRPLITMYNRFVLSKTSISMKCRSWMRLRHADDSISSDGAIVDSIEIDELDHLTHIEIKDGVFHISRRTSH